MKNPIQTHQRSLSYLAGSPRVEGDEEETFDDLDNEFEYGDPRDSRHITESMLASRLCPRNPKITTPSEMDSASISCEIPLLTYGQVDAGISPDKHALIIPPFLGRGRRIHPVVETESSMSLPPRAMDPKKDLAVYGYGTVTWKDRMKEWRRRQNDKLQMVKHEGNGGDDEDDPNLPTMDKGR